MALYEELLARPYTSSYACRDSSNINMNEDRMPIISDILQFMECPWDEEIEIQTMD